MSGGALVMKIPVRLELRYAVRGHIFWRGTLAAPPRDGDNISIDGGRTFRVDTVFIQPDVVVVRLQGIAMELDGADLLKQGWTES